MVISNLDAERIQYQLNPSQVGLVTEAIMMAKLISVGYTVLVPYGNQARYDLVIERNGVFSRVQCKTAHTEKNSSVLVFKAYSTSGRLGNGRRYQRRMYVGDIDYFGVYHPLTDSAFLIPIDIITSVSGRLRLLPTINNQVRGVLWAADYLIKEAS